MMLRTLALAIALSCGFASSPALAAKKPAKVKTAKPKIRKTGKTKVIKPKNIKPKKDKRSQANNTKPRKMKKHA